MVLESGEIQSAALDPWDFAPQSLHLPVYKKGDVFNVISMVDARIQYTIHLRKTGEHVQCVRHLSGCWR